MRINGGYLLKAPTVEASAYQVEDWELVVAEGAPPELVNGSATLLRTPAGVLATAHLALHTWDACSRCLKEVDIPLEIGFEEEFLATVDVFTGTPPPHPA